jgi:iron complex transport system substrate-binding protein
MAPSITEVLFALDLGDQVAGVTRYCDYPPQALSKRKIGGYYDPNYESIIAVAPDLIIMLPEHRETKVYLERIGCEVLTVDHTTIEGIHNSIMSIGERCGEHTKTRLLINDIDTRLARIEEKTRRLRRPTVMVSVGRNMGSGTIEDLYIAGTNNIFNEMITLAGGENAYHGGAIPYPMISAEGLLRMNPEVIIDLVPDIEQTGYTEETVLKYWQSMDRLRAVKNNRVHVFGQGHVVVPGPRFVVTLEAMARAIHPEMKW